MLKMKITVWNSKDTFLHDLFKRRVSVKLNFHVNNQTDRMANTVINRRTELF